MKSMRDYINLVEAAMQESKNKQAYEYHRDMAKLDTRPGRKDIHNALANKYGKRMDDEKKAQKPQGVAEGSDMSWIVYRQETTLYPNGERDHDTEIVKTFTSDHEASEYADKLNAVNRDDDIYYFVRGGKQGVAEEQVEESSPEAISKINELTRRP